MGDAAAHYRQQLDNLERAFTELALECAAYKKALKQLLKANDGVELALCNDPSDFKEAPMELAAAQRAQDAAEKYARTVLGA